MFTTIINVYHHEFHIWKDLKGQFFFLNGMETSLRKSCLTQASDSRLNKGINKCSCIRRSELWNFVSHSIFRYSSDIDRYQWFSLYIVLSTFSKLVNKLQLNWWFDLCFGMFHGLIMELVKHDVPWTFKGYLRYKTTTFQNVPSEAQVKNFFIS